MSEESTNLNKPVEDLSEASLKTELSELRRLTTNEAYKNWSGELDNFIEVMSKQVCLPIVDIETFFLHFTNIGRLSHAMVIRQSFEDRKQEVETELEGKS